LRRRLITSIIVITHITTGRLIIRGITKVPPTALIRGWSGAGVTD